MTDNSINVQIDFHDLRKQISNLSDDDINNILFYLENKGLINKCIKHSHLNATMISKFYITQDFLEQ